MSFNSESKRLSDHSESAKPLTGIRVLAVEQFGAGPYGTMFLADLGAEVIKIENPTSGGDPGRYTGPFLLGEADSEYFQSWNINKRSVALDLKSGEGRDAFRRLAATADAIVNNLRGDQPEKLGLDYNSLKSLNPAVVCLHISAYGRDNDRKAWPGYDFLMQAEAGLMSVTGEPDGPPTKFGPSIIDYMTGMTGMVGLLSCLIRARQTGVGCDVDTCLFDVAVHQMSYAATWYLNHRHVTGRQPRSAHFSVAPVQTFPTHDGWIFVMCMTEKFWASLLDALNRADLAVDERFATFVARLENRAQLTSILDTEFRKKNTEHWLGLLSGLIPIAPVYDMEQALTNPFLAQTGMLREIAHPSNPSLRILSNPIKVDRARPTSAAGAQLGADTDSLVGSGGIL
ncbi:CaiB/BaiF CoA transferase family protein [Bradyrhizobium zhanjiangense]|uniref:CoA-transferase n=1 Tax=Bradyrhizobium zhanjiangense TaxID=1325107 RepID=A0A4Q0SR54_9BRAD|nr:CoA transferase [Bradyrhizobium zhanjiangense]RXH40396.1 CoA-transferase [Bradyrhizobium zhanjiangense]